MLDVYTPDAETRQDLKLPEPRRFGELAVAATENYVDVELGTEQDPHTLSVRVVPDSPTAYMDSLRYGQTNKCTVLWGALSRDRADSERRKMAVIIGRGELSSFEDVKVIRQKVASSFGEGLVFSVLEHYGEDSWNSVILPQNK